MARKRAPSPTNKFNARKKAKFIELLRKGQRRGEAARACGVCRQTVWLAMTEDSAFGDAVDEAEMDANEVIENALYKKAKAGNVVAIQVWLYNRLPDRWKDQRALGKLDAVEGFLARLPAELAAALRPYLGPALAGTNAPVPGK